MPWMSSGRAAAEGRRHGANLRVTPRGPRARAGRGRVVEGRCRLRELELPAAAAAGAGRPGHVPGTPRGLEAMRGGWWHGVGPVRGRGGRARGGGRPGSTGAWGPQAEQPLDGGPGGDVSRRDAAGCAS